MTRSGAAYRPAEYRPVGVLARIWPLAELEFRAPLRSRWSVLLFVLLLGPNLAWLALILILSGVWQLGGPGESGRRVMDQMPLEGPDRAAFYLEPTVHLPLAFLVVVIVTTLVGSRAVARDVATNALELLWTRGVSPFGYFLGKWLGASMVLGLYTVLAPSLLWLVSWGTAEDGVQFLGTLAFLPRVLLALTLLTFTLTGLAVAVSTCFARPNAASIAWAVGLVGSTMVTTLVARWFVDQSWLLAANPWFAVVRITEAIAGVEPRRPVPLVPSLWFLLGLAGALAFAVRRRLRVTEAIA